MPDDLFALPRLARIYDAIEGGRPDLDAYVAVVGELGARRVLDVGCGTGVLACRLAALGLEVTGVDPAEASLAVARGKPGAEAVTWVHAAGAEVPAIDADLAIMTGNVAMVFLDDLDWSATLAAIRRAVRTGGWFVFEVRRPAARGWEAWTPEATREVVDTVEGPVTHWVEVTEVALPYVSFDQHYVFDVDGDHRVSTSTLRFRERDEVERDLTAAGFDVVEVREAPDRPGLEHVFVARAV